MTKLLKTCPEPAKPPYSGKVYKVWHKACNRWYAHIRTPGQTDRLRLYSKYIYETTIGESVSKGYTVDHIDGDPMNDSFDNLQLLTGAANSSKHASMFRTRKMVELRCPNCGKRFVRVKGLTCLCKARGKLSCCSKQCAGALRGRDKLAQSDYVVREFMSAADSPAYIREVAGSTPATRTIIQRPAEHSPS